MPPWSMSTCPRACRKQESSDSRLILAKCRNEPSHGYSSCALEERIVEHASCHGICASGILLPPLRGESFRLRFVPFFVIFLQRLHDAQVQLTIDVLGHRGGRIQAGIQHRCLPPHVQILPHELVSAVAIPRFKCIPRIPAQGRKQAVESAMVTNV